MDQKWTWNYGSQLQTNPDCFLDPCQIPFWLHPVLYACSGKEMLCQKQDLCYLKVTAVQYNDKTFHNYIPREAVYLTLKRGSLIESNGGSSCNIIRTGREQYKEHSSYSTDHLALRILGPYCFLF